MGSTSLYLKNYKHCLQIIDPNSKYHMFCIKLTKQMGLSVRKLAKAANTKTAKQVLTKRSVFAKTCHHKSIQNR